MLRIMGAARWAMGRLCRPQGWARPRSSFACEPDAAGWNLCVWWLLLAQILIRLIYMIIPLTPRLTARLGVQPCPADPLPQRQPQPGGPRRL